MSILCATDFSAPAGEAGAIAALLAARLDQPLSLVHVAEARPPAGGAEEARLEALRARLDEEAGRLRQLGARVEPELLIGNPDETIVEHAHGHKATMVVLAALGSRQADHWLLGSTAERVAQTSPVPVLTVRAGEPLRAWAEGAGTLRVLVAVSESASDERALRWAAELRRVGPCELIAGHVFYPPAENRRRGGGGADLDRVDPGVDAALRREVAARLDGLALDPPARVVVAPGMGRIADHLVALAERERADLVVAGTHQRHGLDRLWHGSVSHGVVRFAARSVACVPTAGAAAAATKAAPRARRVLIATDLSPLSNEAVGYGYAVADTGSVVHLLHVVEPHTLAPAARSAERTTAAAALRALIPAAAADRGIETEVEVVAADRVADTICDTAERLDADLIVLGSHGRSGLTATLAGSVAQAVMADRRRPLLLHRPLPA